MSKLVWSLIAVILLHSFFSCEVAAGHVDIDHHSHDTQHQSEAHADRSDSVSTDSEANHEHHFHAHISCITGYAAMISDHRSASHQIMHQLSSFTSNDNQPPVPPPNA